MLLAATNAQAGTPQPARIAKVTRQVFGSRWKVAACIARHESTDGAWLFNGPNLGIFQINVQAHPWVNRGRVVTDWLYAAKVAFVISDRGRHWRPWSTATLCGAPL